MISSNVIIFLIDWFNRGMDKIVPAVCVVALIVLILSYTRKRIAKDGLSKGIYMASLAAIEGIILVFILGYFPIIVSREMNGFLEPATIRWIILYLLGIAVWYMVPRHIGGTRGLYTIIILLTTFCFGWFYDRWVGISFISLPILLIYYHVLNKVAQIIIPAADPDDRSESRQRTMAFLNYMFGIQSPFWVAKGTTAREFDERIKGDPTNDFGSPGVVWTWPHQVVGLSRGIQFNRVDGPGTIFTEVFESPVALVDLRTHLRTTVIEALTRDGLKVPAVVFMAFAIDKGKWPKEGWSRAYFAKMKHMFPGNPELDHTRGSYPYSSSRVRSVIGTARINSNRTDGERADIYWDEWVVKQVEQAAREVLIDRSLDELWRPRIDGLGVSALDEMAKGIKDLVAPRLADVGIELFGARIVNYEFAKDSSIVVQNIKTWSTYWEQQIIEAHADAEAIYREEISRAHAFSKSVLLDAIAESIGAARMINADLPRHVIAQYYVHALEEYVKKEPGIDIAESKKRVEDLKGFLFYNRTESNE